MKNAYQLKSKKRNVQKVTVWYLNIYLRLVDDRNASFQYSNVTVSQNNVIY